MERFLERSKESFTQTIIYMNNLTERLRSFIENEARSCSMDFGCVTPEYVYRMWGGKVEIEEIKKGLREIQYGCR